MYNEWHTHVNAKTILFEQSVATAPYFNYSFVLLLWLYEVCIGEFQKEHINILAIFKSIQFYT